MEDIKIQFEGFSPQNFAKTYFKSLAEEIRNEAPTWATVTTAVHKKGAEFSGIVKITSHAGSFFAAAKGKRLTDVGRKLLQRIRKQLGKWKAKRFTHETIRDPKVWANIMEDGDAERSA